MRRISGLVFIALAGCVAWSQAAKPVITDVTPVEVVRGSTVTLTGTGLDGVEIRLTQTAPDKPCTNKDPAYGGTLTTAITPTTNPTTVTFLVPATVPLGGYTICVFGRGQASNSAQTNGVPSPILRDSGRLQVLNDLKVPVKVTSVYKSVNYPAENSKTKTYGFTVLGEGFSIAGPDNKLLDDGREIPVCWKDGVLPCKYTSAFAEGVVVSAHQLEFSGVPWELKGVRKVQIRVESSTSDPPIETTLAEIGRWTPLKYALGVFAVLVGLVWWLLGTRKSGYTVNQKKKSLLTMLFLDQETDTFSLSKAQFYVWTAAAALGYCYLTIARSMLQHHFDFAPVPDNLPSTLLVSAATATVALGVNGAKPKGAGNEQPSLADFITTGGLVAPERLQFLVWTILGVLTFLFLILSSDPATLQELPKIPDKFLYLMGISSTGYLGGRMARKAGPVVDQILASISSLTLEIHGRNLSKDASFQIDGDDVKLDVLAPGETGDHRPEIVATDDQAQDPNIAKVMKVTITSPSPRWLTRKANSDSAKREHLLSFINPDGQKADWKYTIPGPTAVLSANVGAGSKVLGGGTLTAKPTDDIVLDSAESRPGDDPIQSYDWRRTDSGASIGTTPSVTQKFGVAGTYQISLKVTDTKGLSDSSSVTIIVEPLRGTGDGLAEEL